MGYFVAICPEYAVVHANRLGIWGKRRRCTRFDLDLEYGHRASSLVLCKVFLLGNEKHLIRAGGVYHRRQKLQGFCLKICCYNRVRFAPLHRQFRKSEAELYRELNQADYEAARQLSPEQRRRLAAQLLEEVEVNEPPASELTRKQRALSIVEETFGAIKGLDRVALAQLAEDEEFSGY